MKVGVFSQVRRSAALDSRHAPPAYQWQDDAACAGSGAALDSRTVTEKNGTVQERFDPTRLLSLCRSCPVRGECLRAAATMEMEEPGSAYLVWGGINFGDKERRSSYPGAHKVRPEDLPRLKAYAEALIEERRRGV